MIDLKEMGSKWRKAKLALGLNMCLYVPRDPDEDSSPSSSRLSDAVSLSPASALSRGSSTPTPSSSGLRFSKYGAKSSKVRTAVRIYVYIRAYILNF